MKYVKRYNKFNFQTKCRICLTQSVTKMVGLDEPLKGEMFPSPLVYEAVEFVMSEKVNLSGSYPHAMCAICVELLKISYDLKIQYQESEKSLREQFRQLGELSDSDSTEGRIKVPVTHDFNKENDGKASVEVVLGHQKFNIKDLLIVEDEKENQSDQLFDGFLSNLGTTISASFVKKGSQKSKPVLEEPSIVIEKVNQEPEGTSENQEIPHDFTGIYVESIENTYDYDLNEPNDRDIDDDNGNNDDMFIDTPIDDEMVDRYIILNDNDNEALQAAMKYKYKCPYCEKPMVSLKKVKLHSSVCLKNNLNVTCYICDKNFRLRKYLLKHLKDVHVMGVSKSPKSKESEKHKCRVCGKVFRSTGSLFYHMNKHLGRRFPCDQCDKKFYTRSQAAIHKQTHNRNNTLVVCSICGKGFHYRSGLFYHMKMHLNERNYQCSYCPKKFYTRNSLKRHELTHTGDRPYSCNHCEKRFRSWGEVKKHELLHTGERPYPCKYCHLSFSQAHNLKVHLMTHPGNYNCIHCSRGFAEKEILRFHLRNKHGLTATLEDEDDLNIEMEEGTVEQDLLVEDTIDEEANPEKDIILDEAEQFFITEDFVGDVEVEGKEVSIVKTYEIRDEVLVETVEEDNLQ